MIIVRYADDFVVGFEHEADARRFLDAMRERLEEFALSLHPEKTRLIEFGRHAAAQPQAARAWQTGDLQLPGLHLHLRQDSRGANSSSSGRPGATACGRSCKEIKEELRRAHAPAHPRTGKMAEAGRHGLLQLSRGADERSRRCSAFRHPRHRPLATHASAAQSEGRHDVGADRRGWPTTGSQTAHPSSLARAALCRQTPEVGAVCPNRARTDLCGGRPVTGVPTAITLTPVKTHFRDLAARLARGLHLDAPPEEQRERECRVHAAPAVSCAIVRRKRTRAYRYSRNTPAFPAQWLYGLWRALPGDEFVLPPSLAN